MDFGLILIIFLIIIVPIIIFFISARNLLISLDQSVQESFSTMDIYLKKRYDLIPSLVTVVKNYAKHESETLIHVTDLRSKALNSGNPADTIKLNQSITPKLANILAVAENYPTLKASQNFQDLSNNLIKVEDEIANSRKYYNGCVRLFNTKIHTFPTIIIAKLLHFTDKPLFTTSDKEKSNTKISL